MKTGKGAYRHFRAQWWGLQDKDKKDELFERDASQPPRCMPRPHNQLDIDDCRQAIQGIQHLRQTNPELARIGVEYYLTKSVASHPHLRMITPEAAEQFAAFIQSLGFSRTRIHCQLKPQTRDGAITQSLQMAYWTKLLSITPSQIKLTQSLKERGADHGTLSIMLSYRLTNGSIQASYGFRYALYMMGILMLAAQEITIEISS